MGGNKKWQATLMHKTQEYHGGYFDIEEHAAMKVNLLCDKYGEARKNPMIIIEPDAMQKKTKSQLYQSKEENIVNKDEVKVEDTNILNGFKNECENLFMKNNDAENYINFHIFRSLEINSNFSFVKSIIYPI